MQANSFENPRQVVVQKFSEAPLIQVGNNKLSGLATSQQGSQQFEVWTAQHAAKSATYFHRHESDEVLIFLKGKGLIRTREKEFPFEAPCSVILPAGTLHQVVNLSDEATEAFGIIAPGSRIFDEAGRPATWRESYLKQQDH
jgi:mannose-6-phosphate isomerase-like protein (cupin superfamily)